MKEGSYNVFLHSISIHPHQPEIIATSSSSGYISIWDTRKTNYPIGTLKGSSTNIWEIQF
jgi:WD40 repeat protein